MPSPQHADYCILGAGIAGLSLADALHQKGYAVAVVEKETAGAGASGMPGGLINPATGRKATKSWKAEACYKAVSENLEKLEPFSEKPFFSRNGVLRPAQTSKMARKMHEQFQQTSWKEGWALWMTEDEINDFHPGVHCVEGGLWLPIAVTVDIGGYTNAYCNYLKQQDIPVICGHIAGIQQKNDYWLINSGGSQIISKNLVFATGYGVLSSPYWKELSLHAVKGQAACFSAPAEALSFSHSVSGLGYVARLEQDTIFVQGSTYEHNFSHLQPDQSGEEYLRKRLRNMLKELAEVAVLEKQWAGIRVSTGNRKPVIGRHKDFPNLHLFTGLGSKGLLYGKYLAEHYANHLHDNEPLFEEVSISRMYKKQGN